MPGLKMADSPVLCDKSRRETFQPANEPCLEFTKNLSSDTKQPFWKDIGARNDPERPFYSFSLALTLLLSFLFLLTISRPPVGMSEIKNSFTLYTTLAAMNF